VYLYRDVNNGIQSREFVAGSGWQAAVSLGKPAAASVTWDPDAATSGSGHVDVAVRDARGYLDLQTFGPGSGWTGWRTYPQAVLSSSPSAVSRAPGELDVYYLGRSNTLWLLRWTQAAGWTGPTKVPGVTNAVSGPDAVTWALGSQHVDVVYRGSDGWLWIVSLDATHGGWAPPQRANIANPLPAPAATLDPAAGSTQTGSLSIYYTAVDGVVYHSGYRTGVGWSAWVAISGDYLATSAPDVANQGSSRVDVLIGQDGEMRTSHWLASSGWSPWGGLG
jgi:hypothetical protein